MCRVPELDRPQLCHVGCPATRTLPTMPSRRYAPAAVPGLMTVPPGAALASQECSRLRDQRPQGLLERVPRRGPHRHTGWTGRRAARDGPGSPLPPPALPCQQLAACRTRTHPSVSRAFPPRRPIVTMCCRPRMAGGRAGATATCSAHAADAMRREGRASSALSSRSRVALHGHGGNGGMQRCRIRLDVPLCCRARRPRACSRTRGGLGRYRQQGVLAPRFAALGMHEGSCRAYCTGPYVNVSP